MPEHWMGDPTRKRRPPSFCQAMPVCAYVSVSVFGRSAAGGDMSALKCKLVRTLLHTQMRLGIDIVSWAANSNWD